MEVWLLGSLIGLPVLVAAGAIFMFSERELAWGQFFMALCNLAVASVLLYTVLHSGPVEALDSWIRVDALSGYLAWLISLIGAMAAFHSIGYIGHEMDEGILSSFQFRWYYAGLHLFLTTMLLVCIVNNIGVLWVAIEASTLVSALLVAFHRVGPALEAAWKYLIIGSVGIAIALLGIILLYASVPESLPRENFLWTDFMQHAAELNPKWLEPAFLFILVGFGTKSGLAPMHFWLPDAHSQAPSPISALLSAVLLNSALYGILRMQSLVDIVHPGWAGQIMIVFGLISIAITVPFFLVQNDLKRLLAYSSVEHMGIITLGFGIGGLTATFGALLHMFNHAIGKSLLFFAAGNIMQRYHSKRMDRIQGVIRTMPLTGPAFLIGSLAIAGSPPFSLFLSEFTIATAAYQEGHWLAGTLFLTCVSVIFAGMAYYVIRMVYGPASNRLLQKKGRLKAVALLPPLLLIIVFGLYVPPFFVEMLHQVAHIFQGGKP